MSDSTAEPKIQLRDIVYVSGTFTVLNEVCVDIPGGQCSIFLGQAGSGKSSLLKVAAGLIIPQQGQILIDGKKLLGFSHRQEQQFRASSGFVFQDSALWQDTTILNNVAMPLRVHQPKLDAKILRGRVEETLTKLGYTDDLLLRPADLSSGEQKLISIARAIVHKPDIVFMDDPTSALDEDAVDRLSSILSELKQTGTTVVIATNNTELAYRHADNLGVIANGRILVFDVYDTALSKVELNLSGSLARLLARGRRANRNLKLPDIDNPEIVLSEPNEPNERSRP